MEDKPQNDLTKEAGQMSALPLKLEKNLYFILIQKACLYTHVRKFSCLLNYNFLMDKDKIQIFEI